MNEVLLKAGLYGAGLVQTTPALVARYNTCLSMLGVESTSLSKFRIDGFGWSPEVSQEKGGNYLCNGAAQYAVILTPDQRKRPVYFPFSSFDRRMIDVFFERFGEAVADITATHGLVLDIDYGLSTLEKPSELLLIDSAVVRTTAEGNLLETAAEQKALETRLLSDGEAWFDASLRKAIIESARVHGDLCMRKLEIPALRFEDLRSFYAEAFGGAFVVRTDPGMNDVLVLEDKSMIESGKRGPKDVFWLHDPRLVERLFDLGVVDIEWDWYRTHIGELDRKLEYIAADALCSSDPELDYVSLPRPRRKSMLAGLKTKISPAFGEVERLRQLLSKGAKPNKSTLSPETRLALLHPSRALPKWYRRVVWQLICRLSKGSEPLDPLRLYVVDKNRFFRVFETWPRSKQVWAAKFVADRYVPHKDMKEEEQQ